MRLPTKLALLGIASGLGVIALSIEFPIPPTPSHTIRAVDYWDAHTCVNHLDGSLYEGTADKLSEFPKEDTCKEYVHHTGEVQS